LNILEPGEKQNDLSTLEANVIFDSSRPITVRAQSMENASSFLLPSSVHARSQAGHSYKCSNRLQHLPPLSLLVSLPPDYLSEATSASVPPQFELSAFWLASGQLSQLCQQLDQLWHDNLGQPILFVWLEWLRTEALCFLKMLEDGSEFVDMTSQAEHVQDCRAKGGHCSDMQRLLELMDWNDAKEREISAVRCHNCHGSIVGHAVKESKLCCAHSLCADCTAIVVRMHAEVDSVPHCPVSDCRKALSNPINALEAQATVGSGLGWVLGTPLQQDLVFCPFCETIAVDTPIAFNIVEKSIPGAMLECKCYNCHWTFCGICRSPCHPGEACEAAKDRCARMANRRPPLPKQVVERLDLLSRLAVEEQQAIEEAMSKEDCVDFETFRDKFLCLHETSLRKMLGAGLVDLSPAPMGEQVTSNFMRSLRAGMRHGIVPEVRPAWHGTNINNHGSIFSRGLLIPGVGNELSIVNGAVHGRGIYTANLNALWLSLGFCSGPRVLVCAVLQLGSVTFPGDAMVVFDASHVIPVFEAKFSSHSIGAYGVRMSPNMTPAAIRHIANAQATSKKVWKPANDSLPPSNPVTSRRKVRDSVDCNDEVLP